MDFSNTLPEARASPTTKMHCMSFSGPETAPSYHTFEEEPRRCDNVRWTPAHCAKYDYVLHIVSLILGTLTLAAYIFDLAKSASYHVNLPVALKVVDAMSISFLTVNNLYSIVYFVTDMYTSMSQGELGRKWPTVLDQILHCVLLGMADTTLSMRSSDSKNSCDKNREVGGCLPGRRAVMITAGVAMIVVSVAAQLRFGITMQVASERRKLANAARLEAARNETGLTWDNDIR